MTIHLCATDPNRDLNDVRSWLSAAASVIAANVRCQVDEREDSEGAERQQWVDERRWAATDGFHHLNNGRRPMERKLSDLCKRGFERPDLIPYATFATQGSALIASTLPVG